MSTVETDRGSPPPPSSSAPKRRPAGGAVTHLSPAEREARGKTARVEVPRSSQAQFEPPPSRPDPVSLLEQQAESRVQELVPIRYGRMLLSPFAFFRGAALVMASDLAATPRSGLMVQACGDAHLSNFGVFASPERALVFDLNDFDETLPGPWEWDVKRLAASIEIAGQERGFSDKERHKAVVGAAAAYRTRMLELAQMNNMDVWYARIDVDRVLSDLGSQLKPTLRSQAAAAIAKAKTRDSLQAFDKLTTVVNGERRIVADPPLVVPVDQLLPAEQSQALTDQMHRLVTRYRRTLPHDRQHILEQFHLVQLARKVVGVGSVGTRAWIVLMLGKDDGDPLFLQAKEAQPSVLEQFVTKSRFTNCGQRVVAGQHLMQASSDIFLGWERIVGIDGVRRDFYVRQLRDWKGSAEIENMIPAGLTGWGQLCGATLARAHARSGDRIGIASYLGKSDAFEQAIALFSAAYADQNDRDYQALQHAVAAGRITAETGL